MGSIPTIPSSTDGVGAKKQAGQEHDTGQGPPLDDLPDDYKTFAFVSLDQLICVGRHLDVIKERPAQMTLFDLSKC